MFLAELLKIKRLIKLKKIEKKGDTLNLVVNFILILLIISNIKFTELQMQITLILINMDIQIY